MSSLQRHYRRVSLSTHHIAHAHTPAFFLTPFVPLCKLQFCFSPIQTLQLVGTLRVVPALQPLPKICGRRSTLDALYAFYALYALCTLYVIYALCASYTPDGPNTPDARNTPPKLCVRTPPIEHIPFLQPKTLLQAVRTASSSSAGLGSPCIVTIQQSPYPCSRRDSSGRSYIGGGEAVTSSLKNPVRTIHDCDKKSRGL